MESIIKVQNLRKVYRVGHERVAALDNINLEIFKGQIICILGTSGSGKSTLLNQLAGLEKPTAGDVFIGKRCISKMNENQLAAFRQKNIGFIFQSYNLLPNMSAVENVAMPLMFRGMSPSKRNRMAADMLRKVDLGGRLKHKPSEMSGGQQQRVGIARAFVARPAIVFADEPTGNLDTRTTFNVMKMIIEMTRKYKITFILVTHDPELAQYADRIITLLDGHIVSDKENISLVDRTESEVTIEEDTEGSGEQEDIVSSDNTDISSADIPAETDEASPAEDFPNEVNSDDGDKAAEQPDSAT